LLSKDWEYCLGVATTLVKPTLTLLLLDERKKDSRMTKIKGLRIVHGERGKRDFDCDKQVEKVVTAPNCVLKGSWGEGGSKGIRKKLKSEYAAYLESKFRRNDGSSI